MGNGDEASGEGFKYRGRGYIQLTGKQNYTAFGKVSYYISTNDFGTFARLQNVLMEEDNFIEYESSGGSGKAGDEFGSKPVKTEAPRKEVLEARPEKAAPAKKAKEVPVDTDDELAPF